MKIHFSCGKGYICSFKAAIMTNWQLFPVNHHSLTFTWSLIITIITFLCVYISKMRQTTHNKPRIRTLNYCNDICTVDFKFTLISSFTCYYYYCLEALATSMVILKSGMWLVGNSSHNWNHQTQRYYIGMYYSVNNEYENLTISLFLWLSTVNLYAWVVTVDLLVIYYIKRILD